MPEGDTVWLAAKRMRECLAGGELVRADLRVPALATTDLTGRTVLDVVPRGKHLLTRLSGDLTLHSHFMMDGEWHLYRPGASWRGGPAYEIRAILETAGWQAVGYRLHGLAIVRTEREGTLVGHLGPDLLGPDWDADEAVRRLREHPDREIGTALMDQRSLAGIGNLYRCETLFLHRTTPWTPLREVADLPAVVATAQRLMSLNREHPEQRTTGMPGLDRAHWVYGRARRPCLRCGTPIAVTSQGDPTYERVTYWCPRCQLGPAPAVDSARHRSSSW